MTLQELLDMPLLSYVSDCSGRIVRVPGGWLFDRCFVPEPTEVILREMKRKETTLCQPSQIQKVTDLFGSMGFYEIERTSTGGLHSPIVIVLTFEGRENDVNAVTLEKIRVISFNNEQ